MDASHYRRLEQLYLSGNVNRLVFPGTTIEVRHGAATVGMPVAEQYFHAMQGLHGCVYFKLLDDAAFFAANSVVSGCMLLTTSFSLYFFRPVTSGWIRAEGKLIASGKNLFSAQADLYNEQGKIIASGAGQFAKGPFELT